MTTEKPIAPARLASTILLLRDGRDGLEVFMVVRHHEIDFASGALVFPGGSVDKADRDPRVRTMTSRCEAFDDDDLAFRVAAIREAFEECGVLLARPRGSRDLVDAQRLKGLENAYRAPLERGEVGIADMLDREGLELACDLLVPYARWITPVQLPKRFDTMFFLAKAPEDHVAIHDGRESVDSVWISPDEACRLADASERTVIFPTRLNLEKLSRTGRSVEAACTAASSAPVVTVMPRVEKVEGGRIMHIPIEAGYGESRFAIEGNPGAGSARRMQLAQPLGESNAG
ncbi:MAG: NUDIX hydrolase [Alphaproteobacteria bacterium]